MRIRYRIKPGDTLTSIASRYSTTVRELSPGTGCAGPPLAAGNLLTVYTRP